MAPHDPDTENQHGRKAVFESKSSDRDVEVNLHLDVV
jgi:hypothetical protein